MKIVDSAIITPISDEVDPQIMSLMGPDAAPVMSDAVVGSQDTAGFAAQISANYGQGVEEQVSDFLGTDIPFFDGPGLWRLLILFGINLLVCWVITHFFYYKKSHRRDYYFTYLLFSTAIFFILYQLQNMKVEVGIALGLFGIFSMIRYRTEQLPIREMTYLFVLIAISIVNGAGMASSYASFIATNVLFIVLVGLLETLGFSHREANKIITYEKIELIKPERRAELIADIESRTGLKVRKIQIGSVDFLKDTAFIKVTYIPEDSEPNDIDMVTKFRRR